VLQYHPHLRDFNFGWVDWDGNRPPALKSHNGTDHRTRSGLCQPDDLHTA